MSNVVIPLCESRPCFESASELFLYNWQALIGGSLALLGAIIGAYFLWSQISQNERHESDRRARNLAATRAAFPHSLSVIHDYLSKSMKWMMDTHDDLSKSGDSRSQSVQDPPHFPTDITSSFERLIQATDDMVLVGSLSSVLGNLQTFRAKIGDVVPAYHNPRKTQVGLESNLEDFMFDAATISWQLGPLFRYARGTAEFCPESPDAGIFNALYGLGCSEIHVGRVFARANRFDAKMKESDNWSTIRD